MTDSILAAPWLAEPLAFLRAQRAAGRLPHALLLCGPRGWGKQALVRQWLGDLLALPAAHADEELAHPDLRIVVAEREGDAAQIKIDQIRELAEFVTATASGAIKVGVIEDAERMNLNAANALLKTLEEPVGATHLVLTSARPWALLPTIRSRLALLRVRADRVAAAKWLAALPDAERPSAEVQWLVGGAPMRSRDLHNDGSAAALLELLRTLVEVRGAAPLTAPELQAVVQRIGAVGVVAALDGWQRLVHAGIAGSAACDGPPAWAAVAGPARPLLGFADALAWSKRAAQSSANPNATLLCESLLLRWASLPAARGS